MRIADVFDTNKMETLFLLVVNQIRTQQPVNMNNNTGFNGVDEFGQQNTG